MALSRVEEGDDSGFKVGGGSGVGQLKSEGLGLKEGGVAMMG